MSKEKFQAARALIQNKQYDKARKILKSIDHPKAKEWLARLDTIASEPSGKKRSEKGRLIVFGSFVSFVVLILLVALLFAVGTFSSNEDAPSVVPTSVADVVASSDVEPVGEVATQATSETGEETTIMTDTSEEETATNTPLPAPTTAVTLLNADRLIVTTLDYSANDCPDNCSLRSAIINAKPGAVIKFADGLTGIISWEQPLTIDKDVTIVGPGAEFLAIDGRDEVKIFDISEGATAQIVGVTIQNTGNRAISNNGTLVFSNSALFNSSGGAIQNSGTLTVLISVLSNNSTDSRGGSIDNSGTVTIRASELCDNSANRGGGIFNTGILIMWGSIVCENDAGEGGGILNEGGIVEITDSQVVSNSADGDGGGILNYSNLNIDNSVIISNSALNGGGIFNSGVLETTNSILQFNMANAGGGGIYNVGDTVIESSVLLDSYASDIGGGIVNVGHTLTITNSTLAHNRVDNGGAAIFTNQGIVTLAASTVAANESGNTAGGIANQGSQDSLNLTSTILAYNTAPSAPNVQGSVTSLGNNLIGNSEGSGGWLPTDLQELDPILLPLGSNGSNIFSMALDEGSPAIAAGNCGGIEANDIPPVTTDQRGGPRKSPCDIGAVESGVEVPTAEPIEVFTLVPSIGIVQRESGQTHRLGDTVILEVTIFDFGGEITKIDLLFDNEVVASQTSPSRNQRGEIIVEFNYTIEKLPATGNELRLIARAYRGFIRSRDYPINITIDSDG